MAKPSIPKGTRDFLPLEMNKRNFIFDTIRSVFKKYAYLPIETPAMEKTETLLGKYGEEGDRLIFKVLQRGEKLKKELAKIANGESSNLAGEALRYDLTVPFARFVSQHLNKLHLPFKRFQIQPVWRADRPQRSRYREFFQCDADVVGSNSLLYEVELIQIFDEVLRKLGLKKFYIKLNNRKLLTGIAQVIGAEDRLIDILVTIDKLDKIGEDKVLAELREKNLSSEVINKLHPLFVVGGDNDNRISVLRSIVGENQTGNLGLDEIEYVLTKLRNLGFDEARIGIEPTLARGLDYYTGSIFEVVTYDYNVGGSICGGGRYDNLTELFGVPDMPGIGISFGADRLYDVIEGMESWPDNLTSSVTLLFVNFGEKESDYVLPLLKKIREAGISSEIFPSAAKIQKQLKYANAKGAEYVAMVGENEMNSGKIVLKNMESGEQQEVSIDELIGQLS